MRHTRSSEITRTTVGIACFNSQVDLNVPAGSGIALSWPARLLDLHRITVNIRATQSLWSYIPAMPGSVRGPWPLSVRSKRLRGLGCIPLLSEGSKQMGLSSDLGPVLCSWWQICSAPSLYFIQNFVCQSCSGRPRLKQALKWSRVSHMPDTKDTKDTQNTTGSRWANWMSSWTLRIDARDMHSQPLYMLQNEVLPTWNLTAWC